MVCLRVVEAKKPHKTKPTTNLDILNLGCVVVIFFLLKELIEWVFSLLDQSGSISPPVLL